MYHDFIKSRDSFWNSYLICPFPSSMSPLRLWLGFLVGILGLVRLPALLLPVTDLLARMAGGVLCWAVLSPWHVAFCAVATWTAVCWWFLCHLLYCTYSFSWQAHWRHVVCDCISAVVASIFIANSFLIRSVSLRAWTIWNWMCLSFSASVGKLHLSASPQIYSTSSSGVLPALILISSSWYILHRWDTGWSMELCRNSIKSLAPFLFFSHSSTVAPEGFHCLCFLHLMGPKKLSRYSSHVLSSGLVRYTLEHIPTLHALDEEPKFFILLWWVQVKSWRFQRICQWTLYICQSLC